VDVIVEALAGIRSAVRARTQIDRRRQSQRAEPGGNDAAAALDQLYAADWSDLLADAEFLNRSDQDAVEQLEAKIRAAGFVTAEDVQSCVESFRVDDDMTLKVCDTVSVARRKILPRFCALITPRVVVPAVCVHARAHPMCELPVCLHARAHSVCELWCATSARSWFVPS
jgi:hypothetical protein